MKMDLKFIHILHFGILLSLVFSGCSSGKKESQASVKPIPVAVGPVIQKDVPVQIRAIGNVQAYSTVSVKSMVGGELVKVHFSEGQFVKKGDRLFTIDPRPIEAAVKQAEAILNKDLVQVKQATDNLEKDQALLNQARANLERDLAEAKNAELDAQRYKELFEKKVVAEQQYDQFRTNAEALDATVRADRAAIDSAQAAVRASADAVENAKALVQADRAALENANIELGYCFISAPIDGRTGNLLVQAGNIVKANDTPYLVVINQINPIYVSFSVNEENLPEIKKYKALNKLTVEATIPNDDKAPESGVLSFFDNAVDPTTGTIELKGIFPNKDRRLWPGQFVDVVLTLKVESKAIVIPTRAVQTGQQGQYVFVVRSDSTVESRPVAVLRSWNQESVVEGLKPGETVVTDGQLQLATGARVETKNSMQPTSTPQKPE
jgi:membrane fusion protein, multidrug efflux system